MRTKGPALRTNSPGLVFCPHLLPAATALRMLLLFTLCWSGSLRATSSISKPTLVPHKAFQHYKAAPPHFVGPQPQQQAATTSVPLPNTAPRIAHRTPSPTGTQNNSEFELYAERTFDSGDPEQLSSQLADIVKVEGFDIQKFNSDGLVGLRYESSASEDHDEIAVAFMRDSDHPSERITASVQYFRYERIVGAVNREERIPPIGKVRERFNKVVQNFDALEETLKNRPKP